MVSAVRTGVTTLVTPSDTEVRITRVFAAPQKLAFEAYTKPEHLRQWLLGPEGWSMFICEMEPRPGGQWRYGWRKTDGTEMVMGGTVREFVPHSKLVNTERWGPEWPETINTVEFIPTGAETEIRLTIKYPSKEARDAALKTGMKEGLEFSFARLEKLLAELA